MVTLWVSLSIHFLSAMPQPWWWSPARSVNISHASTSSTSGELLCYVCIHLWEPGVWASKYEYLPSPSRYLSTHIQFALCGHRIVKQYSLHMHSHNSNYILLLLLKLNKFCSHVIELYVLHFLAISCTCQCYSWCTLYKKFLFANHFLPQLCTKVVISAIFSMLLE